MAVLMTVDHKHDLSFSDMAVIHELQYKSGTPLRSDSNNNSEGLNIAQKDNNIFSFL